MLVLVFALITSLGCPKKPDPRPEPEPEPVYEPEPEEDVIEDEEEAAEVILLNFQKVHFEYDSTDLVGPSRDALGQNATILQDFPNLSVEIQGHADERGTTEYNLALGQKRAQNIKEYLASMGVGSSRLSIVSYGEERPAEGGSSEWAWSQNRRAEFRVMRSGDAPVKGTIE